MALRITHLDGPLAGKVQDFPNNKARISIGRVGGDIDVRYPDDFTAVSREHLVLVEGPGIYRLDVSVDKPVFINGKEALQDQEIKGTVEAQLGGKDGPRLRLEVNPDNLGPVTVKREAMVGMADRVKKSGRMTQWVAGAVVAIAAAVVALYFVLHEETVNLAKFFDDQKAQGATQVSAEVLQKARDSVYMVIIEDASGDSGAGTAWVVDKENGILATNSHVAEITEELGAGQSLVVRSPVAPYTTHVVQRVVVHPGYHRFDDVVGAFGPVVKAADKQILDAGLIGAYDVALLYVDQADKLAPALPIASDDELRKLDAGYAVGYVGYPMEGMALTANAKQPTPQSKLGNVTVVTDYFNVRRNAEVNQLIQHDLGATGGASGSPIINAKGEVVAVLSAVNFYFLDGQVRIPSGVGINFGQRADLVRELLENTAQEKLPAYEASWKEALGAFTDFRSVLPEMLVSDWQYWYGFTEGPTILSEEAGKLGPMNDEWGYPVARFAVPVDQYGLYGVYAIADGTEDINLSVVRDGEVVMWDDYPDWYATVGSELDKGSVIQIVVTGPEEGVPFKLKAFFWPLEPPPPQ